MINIIRDKKDVTKAQLWEAYLGMVERYEDLLAKHCEAVAHEGALLFGDADYADELAAERAKCPSCGIPTVREHEALTDDDKTCDGCASQQKQGAV